MAELPHAESFRDPVAYQKAKQVALLVFQRSKRFPKEEVYSLTDQIRRSARSIGANIAEAWGKRPYDRQFVSKLTDADAEQLETQHWTDVAVDCGYLTREEAAPILLMLEEVGRMVVHSMIAKASRFCGTPPSGH